MKVKVCLVSPLPPPVGGIAQWTARLLDYYRNAQEFEFLHVDYAVRSRRLQDDNWIRRALRGAAHLPRQVGAVLRALWQNPHVVHITTSGRLGGVRDLLIILLSRSFGKPVIYHLRFGRVPDVIAQNGYEWWLLRANVKLADSILTLDRRTTAALAAQGYERKLVMVPNPIDCDEVEDEARRASAVESILPRRPAVLFLGLVVPKKGIEELVSAWSKINAPGWDLIVVGSVSKLYEEYLSDRCSGKQIRFVGELGHEDAMGLLAAAEILCLPSHSEGFPNAVLEGMCLGKAILASKVGAIPEMLESNCGMLVDPHDADALKDALVELMENPNLRAELGRRSRERARATFSIEVVTGIYESLWRGERAKNL